MDDARWYTSDAPCPRCGGLKEDYYTKDGRYLAERCTKCGWQYNCDGDRIIDTEPLTTIKGIDIIARGIEVDMGSHPIEPDTDYVVDHVNSAGQPVYASTTWWINSHSTVDNSGLLDGPFAYLFTGDQP